jgi:hypothetical protein
LTRILIYPTGISVNGIIGSSVFNNNLFEINYEKRKVVFIRTTVETEKDRKKVKKFPLL